MDHRRAIPRDSITTREEGVLAAEMQAASLFALTQARNADVAVVAHISNATDHEGEPFDRGSENEGIHVSEARSTISGVIFYSADYIPLRPGIAARETLPCGAVKQRTVSAA